MKMLFRIQGEGRVKRRRAPRVGRGVSGRADTTLPLIQALIPLGFQAAVEALAAEVTRLAGWKHGRTGGILCHVRWGRQQGSIYPLDRKLSLGMYGQLQSPLAADTVPFQKILLALSCRDYRAHAEVAPETFGLSPSTKCGRLLQWRLRRCLSLRILCLSGSLSTT
jgi:hypothetical protein